MRERIRARDPLRLRSNDRQDVQLVIDGLVYAADLQKRGNQRAGLIAVGAIVGGTVLAAGISRLAAEAS